MGIKLSDIVYCKHAKGLTMYGTVVRILKNDEYVVRVFIPRTKDERKTTYVEELILNRRQLESIVGPSPIKEEKKQVNR